MNAIFGLILSPLAVVFRAAFARPWPAIAISGLAGIAAFYIGQGIVGFVLISFSSYIMIWLDEHSRPRQVDIGSAEIAGESG
ncbi:hypothetical protein [Falsiroseomonas sp. HW251]|uniref:hypothetical protein n=1 Tax=Falsiroseomonas sp. HW251 TaxID=3390998 RepID=UPI003D323E04